MMSLKTKLTGVCIAVLMLAGFAGPVAAQDVFKELTDMPQVMSTYISGRFAHNFKSWYGKRAGQIIALDKGFSSMYKYEITDENAVNKARKILDRYMANNKNVETVMRQMDKSEGLVYEVIEKFGSDGKIYQMLIWNQESSNDLELVVINWKDGIESASKKGA